MKHLISSILLITLLNVVVGQSWFDKLSNQKSPADSLQSAYQFLRSAFQPRTQVPKVNPVIRRNPVPKVNPASVESSEEVTKAPVRTHVKPVQVRQPLLQPRGHHVAPIGWSPTRTGKYYQLIRMQLNWWDASNYCKQIGAQLASFNSQQELFEVG